MPSSLETKWERRCLIKLLSDWPTLSDLFLVGRPSLGQALEPLERVVDEDPVLVDGLSVLGNGRCGDLELDVGELVEVGGVVYGAHVDRNGRRPLPDVVPVHAPEEGDGLELLEPSLRAEPPVRVAAEAHDRVSGFFGDRHLGRERERVAPRHHPPVSLLGVLTAKRWVSCGQNIDDHQTNFSRIELTRGVS